MPRRFAISDIHGCNQTFHALLDKIGLTTADQLYLLGDFVHRGPDSIGVIESVLKMQADGYKVRCFMGNHEESVLDDQAFYSGQAEQPTHPRLNMGDTFVREVMAKFGCIPEHIYDFITNLHEVHFGADYILVHAGFDFRLADPFGDKRAMRWIRDWYSRIDRDLLGGRTIIHGHTPIKRIPQDRQMAELEQNLYIDIDGGCVFGTEPNYIAGYGKLCAFDMDERQLIRQVCVEENAVEVAI